MTKKRYTKQKKSIKDSDTNDIPYTKVRVEWVDALSDILGFCFKIKSPIALGLTLVKNLSEYGDFLFGNFNILLIIYVPLARITTLVIWVAEENQHYLVS